VTKIATGIVERVYGSISKEDWDVLQKYYNGSMDMLDEPENMLIPVPRLTVRVRALLELRRFTVEKRDE
jgi:hypothetical protein